MVVVRHASNMSNVSVARSPTATQMGCTRPCRFLLFVLLFLPVRPKCHGANTLRTVARRRLGNLNSNQYPAAYSTHQFAPASGGWNTLQLLMPVAVGTGGHLNTRQALSAGGAWNTPQLLGASGGWHAPQLLGAWVQVAVGRLTRRWVGVGILRSY